MRTILQILLTASVIVHFSGVIAFGAIELKRRWRRLTDHAQVEGDPDDELQLEPDNELAQFRSRRTAKKAKELPLMTALNQSRSR